jgi:hypothetical protein
MTIQLSRNHETINMETLACMRQLRRGFFDSVGSGAENSKDSARTAAGTIQVHVILPVLTMDGVECSEWIMHCISSGIAHPQKVMTTIRVPVVDYGFFWYFCTWGRLGTIEINRRIAEDRSWRPL